MTGLVDPLADWRKWRSLFNRDGVQFHSTRKLLDAGDALAVALVKYAAHTGPCSEWKIADLAHEDECICGLDEIVGKS